MVAYIVAYNDEIVLVTPDIDEANRLADSLINAQVYISNYEFACSVMLVG